MYAPTNMAIDQDEDQVASIHKRNKTHRKEPRELNCFRYRFSLRTLRLCGENGFHEEYQASIIHYRPAMSLSATHNKPYRGRFAPSPTGPLHFGSLVAAVGSYLDARHHHGEWQLRIEDIDPPREVPGAADGILRTLEAFGLEWDGPVTYQSRRGARYETALDQLERLGFLYGCACTRKEIPDNRVTGAGGGVYPGTCRSGLPPGRTARSLRVRVDDSRIGVQDRLQGHTRQSLPGEVGDFIVRRADGLIAYQLAVVVDDSEQRISHIVRGADLFDSTPRQIYLQRLLGFPEPDYLHLPVAVNGAGEKLAKQTRAREVNPKHAGRILRDVLHFLHQELPESADDATPEELLRWAIARWEVRSLPPARILPSPAQYSD
jgi:glutamyl-Q tRNA(Asp) synthetase